jgi:hypothetical protein
MAIFSVQLPAQSQVKTEKRGQQPFHVDKKQDIRATMLTLAPPIIQVPKTSDFAILDRSVGQLSQWGVLPGCVVNGATERQGLPTLRYQTKGKKEVAVIKFESLCKAMAEHQVNIVGVDLFSAINTFLVNLTTEQLNKSLSAGMKVNRSVVDAGAFIYIPAGHFVLERVIGEELVLGVRTALCTPCDGQSMFELVKAYSLGNPDPPLLKFWKGALSLSIAKEKLEEIIEEPLKVASEGGAASSGAATPPA